MAATNEGTRVEELTPSEGYRRWAGSYGREPNAFQEMEAPILERSWATSKVTGCSISAAVEAGCLDR